MPVLDNDNLDILKEKVEAWRAVERENLSNYYEILNHLTFLTEEVNGHPETTVKMLVEIKRLLAEMGDRSDVPEIVFDVPRPRWMNPWWLMLAMVAASALGSLITLLSCGIVQIPI
jgi:hypothetical protein